MYTVYCTFDKRLFDKSAFVIRQNNNNLTNPKIFNGN